MRSRSRITGLVPAVFTPMHDDGRLNLDRVPVIVEHLIGDGVDGMFVCGTTGEGVSLSSDERRAVAKAYVDAVAGRVPVIVQVGHNSLVEARGLADDAERIGADAIAAAPPSYFRPCSVQRLVQCMAEVAYGAPGTPFYYYHLPGVTGVDYDMVEFLRLGGEKLPTLAGIKYSTTTVHELQACASSNGGHFNILFGSDQMLLSGLCAGAHGAVGSTYNFAAPLYRQIIRSFERSDLVEAQRLQGLAVQMVRVIHQYSPLSALKAMMKVIGMDCGPNRLPLVALCPDEVAALKRKMEAIGFFEWAR